MNYYGDIKRLGSTEFFWERWNSGSFIDIGLLNGHKDINTSKGRKLIRKYAIGYCPGHLLLVRPKNDCTAIMIFNGNITFWTHLTNKEFNLIFKEIKDE